MSSYMCNVIVCFFCFKQKTAYEMRISDWSSDVCSSDLCLCRHRLLHGKRSKEKAGRSPPFHIARRCRDGLLGRCTLAFFDGLHRQADAALLVAIQHLDLDDVAFLELVGALLDAPVGDLRPLHQALLAGGDGDETDRKSTRLTYLH